MKFIAYDLGTGGVKASLYDQHLTPLAKSFIEYDTYYSNTYMHEQKPSDWWNGVVKSTKLLLSRSGTAANEITAVSLSGHSCVAVPIDKKNNLLLEKVPIWSDTRAADEAKEFFQKEDYENWYLKTGNGFPPACYVIFKLMWYQKHMPDIYKQIDVILGSKDYINFKLTGQKYTDYSYASSLGVYDLLTHTIDDALLASANIPKSFFPTIVPSHHIVGTILPSVAEEIGLSPDTIVACGGVDNACMALGSVGTKEGRIYTSLGSSSWVPVNSSKPVLDAKRKPYVFAHIDENMYTSAFSIFSGGSSFRWIRDTLCKDIPLEGAYDAMSSAASSVPPGSNGVFFVPSLAGGTSQDKSVNISGAYVGLHLGNTRADLIRSAMEGIAMNLEISVEYLKEQVELSDEILFCGGGSKSDMWMDMFANIFNLKIIKTNIDQDAASLGAAAICARATGLWENYDKIPELHQIEKEFLPDPEIHKEYQKLLPKFKHICDTIADLGDYLTENR